MTTSADPTVADPSALAARSVRAAIIASARRFPDRSAVRMAPYSGPGADAMTYGQLVDRAGIAANSIAARDANTSNPVVVQVGLSADAVALVLGVSCPAIPSSHSIRSCPANVCRRFCPSSTGTADPRA
ncbi:hypothetical protein LK459_04855 [Gordonia otitidis]|uniref:hypothetical protein n=1 Tax=Gordonia otitidis TaxID=249058 RepID=UPI001D151A07|nr:hypothetical protein [Gordonia otitidis]UEA60203.1 hypothetical protein LK459_04855 [Gordonia otitidis]